MNQEKIKKRMYDIGMSEGYFFVSVANLIIYFMSDSNLFKTFILGSNITIGVIGIGMYLYFRYAYNVKE